MVIAMTNNAEVEPHKHPNKVESFHIIEGTIRIGFLDDKGKIKNITQLDKDQYPYGPTMSCLLYTSPSPRDVEESRMPSSA